MKVIHLSISAGGGAGIAAARTVQALRAAGVDAELWTADSEVLGRRLYSNWWLWLKVRLDALPQRLNRRKRLFSSWSNNSLPSRLAREVNRARPDIVHLHWVGAAFLNLDELRLFDAPVVWTLHDAWAFTGGCHYPGDCRRFEEACGSCPQLQSSSENDRSRRQRKRVRSRLPAVALWIAPSAWMAQLATATGGVPVERTKVVPNGLDARRFGSGSRDVARQDLAVSEGALVLVAGAHDLREPRKGGDLLPAALTTIVEAVGRPVVLFLFGEGSAAITGDWPCEVRYTGFLQSEAEVARIFHAADLMLLPSLQDNLPNTAIEALASGCAVVGFDRGGLKEIVEHGRTGWLTDDVTGPGLGDAVMKWLQRGVDRDEVVRAATERVAREFSIEVQGRRLRDVYATLLASTPVELNGSPHVR